MRPDLIHLFLLAMFCAAAVSAQQITEYKVPTSNAGVQYIATAPDGTVWFSEQTANKIGKLSHDGTFTEYPLPLPLSTPQRIVVTSDGNAWFAEGNAFQIGRMTPSGQLTEFPTSGNPALCSSSDDVIYFDEYGLDRIGRLTADGKLVEYSLPRPLTRGPLGCGADSEGNVWYFAQLRNAIGKLSPSGTSIEYPLPIVSRYIPAMILGRDGNMWFTDMFAGSVGRMTPDGVLTEFPTKGSSTQDRFARPNDIVVGSDGYLWFTQTYVSPEGGDKISGSVVRMDYSGHMTEYEVAGFAAGIAADSTGIWFTIYPDKIAHLAPYARRRAAGQVTEIAPACAQPAPLTHSARPVPDAYIVTYAATVTDAHQTTAQLAAKYGFAAKYVYDNPALRGFAGILSKQALAGVRCESSVARVEEDGLGILP